MRLLCLIIIACLGLLPAAEPDPTLHNQLTLDLLRQQCRADGTQISSGLSLAMALGMSRLGAVGSSRQELDRLLAGSTDPALLATTDEALLQTLAQVDEVVIANAIWSQSGYGWQQTFLDACRAHYRADNHEVDFAGAEPAAREAINAWGSQTTRGLIPQLLTTPLPARTQMVLTNAFSYIGTWDDAFDPALTTRRPFTTGDGAVEVEMMQRTGSMRVHRAASAQLLALPMAGEMDLLLVLPPLGGDLETVVAQVSATDLASWYQHAQPTECHLVLPRCDLTVGGSLRSNLEAMGLQQVFTASGGFTGMADQRDLHISDVIQRCRLQIDEAGVKAAAATAVVMVDSIAAEPLPFVCNQPFLLVLQHRPSGAILLAARISDPRG